ncbi:MAG: hypothetical protein EKK31_29640 [Hyphomicrobiales bacterium]|nr:MAG: hypothetical protein EKK31_29640 [Hyphomicrobiales bacterium]
MDWSVNEDGGAGNRRNRGCLPGLHSHFMAEWKPERPKVSGPSAPYQKADFGRKVPQMAI